MEIVLFSKRDRKALECVQNELFDLRSDFDDYIAAEIKYNEAKIKMNKQAQIFCAIVILICLINSIAELVKASRK